MREIKFRAWEKRTEIMLTVTAIMWDAKVIAHKEPVKRIVEYIDMWPRYEEEYASNYEDCILMQYTGLRDKNGTEIYDGDIVHIDDSYLNDRSHNNLGVIGAFDDSQYLWRVHADLARVGVHGKESYYLRHSTMILEVVGNIYENPELMEAENER